MARLWPVCGASVEHGSDGFVLTFWLVNKSTAVEMVRRLSRLLKWIDTLNHMMTPINRNTLKRCTGHYCETHRKFSIFFSWKAFACQRVDKFNISPRISLLLCGLCCQGFLAYVSSEARALLDPKSLGWTFPVPGFIQWRGTSWSRNNIPSIAVVVLVMPAPIESRSNYDNDGCYIISRLLYEYQC
jgi:hypothetical protein